MPNNGPSLTRIARFVVVEDTGNTVGRPGRMFRCQVHVYPTGRANASNSSDFRGFCTPECHSGLGNMENAQRPLENKAIFKAIKMRSPCPTGEQVLAVAAALPGVAAVGQTETEALDKITKVFQERLSAFLARGEQIPWQPDAGPLRNGMTKAVFAQVAGTKDVVG